ncbi:MAG: UDP-N-acetylmuramate--L-alanine ligase [Candidatus Omnitrophica bacterium]|nr:UDP-N-acetylmuramate--L-alanine ligase [Candidatus Omnitrophota bacterium]
MPNDKIQIERIKVHLVGIGGIGMSGLAFILSGMGASVTGSDIEENSIIKKLRERNVNINIGHKAEAITDQELCVYSTSIRENNPELLAARDKGIPVMPRIELLNLIMERYEKVIGVTGTHGKTTITAMASHLLEVAGMDPTVLIGGESSNFDGNAKLGKGNVLVAEVDESDGRFVVLDNLTHIIMPNLEKEHMEYYRSEAHLLDVFKKFLSAQSAKSTFFYRQEDRNLQNLASNASMGKKSSFGFTDRCDVRAANVRIDIFRIEFDCFCREKNLGAFTINMPGIHNVTNALGVISLGVELGIDPSIIKQALLTYKGVKRRFEVIGEAGGTKIVEDYAHHPTEIKATIAAAYSLKPKRLITIFQPHRYTRTKSFYKEFSFSFAGSDEVILTEVYSASEDKIEGAGARSIYDIMAKGNSIPVKLLEKDAIPGYLSKKAKNGDLILVLGAGDINKTARKILSELKK